MEQEEVGGLTLPGIGLGTMRMDGDRCREVVGAALAEGYRHLDTARSYGNEAALGQALQESAVRREDVVLVTKVPPALLAADDVRETAEESLRRLRTDHVDILLVHWPSRSVPLEETLGAMAELRDRGLARAIGVANFPTALLSQAMDLIDGLVTNQVEYHPYLSQRPVLEQLRAAGMTLTAYCPLGRQVLLHDPDLREIAKDHGRTTAQIALRWLVQQERVITIPGTTTVGRLHENLDALDGPHLTDDEMARISGLARGGRVVDPPEKAPVWDPDPDADGGPGGLLLE
jgi:2,5-diketo-D-gluconate reductase B